MYLGFLSSDYFTSPRDINNEHNVIKPPSTSDQALSATWTSQGRCAVWELTNWPWLTMPFGGPIFLWICRGFSPQLPCALRKWTPMFLASVLSKEPTVLRKCIVTIRIRAQSLWAQSCWKQNFSFGGPSYHLLSMKEVWIVYLKTILWFIYKNFRGRRRIHPMNWTQIIHKQHLPTPDCFLGMETAFRVNCINSQADWRKQQNKKFAYHIEMIIEIIL